MITTRPLVNRYNGNICRSCINSRYRIHLTPKDCKYGHPGNCARCHNHRNIVIGFTFSGKLKMLGKH